TFRRAAHRLHEQLIADQHAPRDFTRQRQAASVYHALVEVRSVVEERTRHTWRQWLTGGRHNDVLPAVVVGTLAGTIGLTAPGLVLRLALGDTPPRVFLIAVGVSGAALVLAAVALAVSFSADRRSWQRLAEELHKWDRVLQPLIFSGQAKPGPQRTE
ncbi:MAG: hypothetical protein ACRD0H_13210, partial [Actinomycetes bacterium]